MKTDPTKFTLSLEDSQDATRSKEMLASYMDQAIHNLSASIDANGLTLPVLTTSLVQFSQSLFPLPDGTACKKTCAYCCHLRVGVSIPEAIVIFNQIKSNATKEGFEFFKLKTVQTGDGNNITKESWWLKSQTPCPFLDTQGQLTCLIYEIRPFSCRAYHSTDADICQKGFETAQKTQIPCFPLYRAFTDMYSSVFIKTMADKGLYSFQVGFIKALQILFQNHEATKLWLAGNDVFKAAKLS